MLGHLDKMPVILNIGITGHRHGVLNQMDEERFPDSQITNVRKQIKDILKHVQSTVLELLVEHDKIYSSEKPKLHFISGMANGADQIGTAVALEQNIEVNAILPFFKDEYLNDFTEVKVKEEFNKLLSNASSIFELPGNRLNESDAYKAVGHFLIAKSDILIAVWDGEKSGGRGGTADMVEHALAAGVAVIHIHSRENQPPIVLNSDGIGEGYSITELKALIKRALLPSDKKGEDAIIKFHQEKEKRFCSRISYPLFLCVMFTRLMKWTDLMHEPFFKTDDDNVTRVKQHLDQKTKSNFDQYINRYYQFSDSLAIRYAQYYRSGFVANFILAAFAVACAVLGGFKVGAGKDIYVPIETVLILLIIINTYWGKRQNWHERWMNYRHLAEKLRLSHVWLLLGTSHQSVFTKRNMQAIHQTPGWVAWYALTASKVVGIPTLKITSEVINIIQTTLTEIALEQKKYHSSNTKNMNKLDHRSHFVSRTLFILTLVACLAYLFLPFSVFGKYNDIAITMITAIFPAFAAAIYGIKSVADFAANAKQSETIEFELSNILIELNQPNLSYNKLLNIANRMDDIMLDDLIDWRQIYQNKQIELP